MGSDAHGASVVLVHGAFHGAWCWDRVVRRLERAGVVVHAVDLPGHGADDQPPGDLHDHADWLRAYLGTFDGPVVLVGHSYGGAVITDAATDVPGVAWLVYLCALMPDVDETMDAAMVSADGAPPSLVPAAMRFDDDGNIFVDPDCAVAAFYADCAPDDVEFALARLRPQRASAGAAASVRDVAWRTIPSTYVVCREDRAVTPAYQRMVAARATEIAELSTGHSPFLAQPQAVADILVELVRRTGR